MLVHRVFLPVILNFTLTLAAQPPCPPETVGSFGIAGPAKSVREEGLGPDGQREVISQLLFDRTGRVLEQRHGFNEGDHWEHQVFRYVYEPQGRNYQIEMFEIDPARPDKLIDLQREFLKFDSQGRCVEKRDIDSDGSLIGWTAYKYDSNGDLVRETDCDADGTILSTQKDAYSPDHKLLSESAVEGRAPKLMLQWSREYRYDPYSNQTDVLFYREGVLEQRFISTYDARNRLTSYRTIVPDANKDQHAFGCSDCGLSSGETTYTYDASGRLTELRSFGPGNKLVRTERYAYDANGNRLPSADAQYSFDAHGNWIKEVSSNGGSAWTIYRIIDYY